MDEQDLQMPQGTGHLMMGMIDQLRVNLANPSVNIGIGYKHPHSFLLLRNTLVYAYMEVGRHAVLY